MLKLVVGDRNYSSWSLRPWLVLKQSGLPFEEISIRLRERNTRTEIFKHSPSGKIPCLVDGGTVVWDSLAICEYIAEKAPSMWPTDSRSRAEARSISAEMHSGFVALRHVLPMDIAASKPFVARTADVDGDIARIIETGEGCPSRFVDAGPFLFGRFTIADAMSAPVVWRFLTYEIELPAASRKWVEAMLALPAMQEWHAAALAEKAAG